MWEKARDFSPAACRSARPRAQPGVIGILSNAPGKYEKMSQHQNTSQGTTPAGHNQ